MKRILALTLLIIITFSVFSRQIEVISPNEKINIVLFSQQNSDPGEWYLKVTYTDHGKTCVVIPQIKLGLLRSDQDFSGNLKFLKADKPRLVQEQYTALHGKRSNCSNTANEVIACFSTPKKARMNIIIRAYNDGVAFRYEFPEKEGTYVVNDELTSYDIPEGTKHWMEKWNLANEGLYTVSRDDKVQQSWCYPALFQTVDSSCWFLIHEADVNRNYCGSKLSNSSEGSNYKITFPDPGDGEGNAQPAITLPWKSPWRVIILGSLADIVESTLVEDVSSPSVISNTDWIKPGVASWNYWSNNHGTKDYKVVCEFTDLAAAMNWPYTLLDWEWDQMGNGGNIEDATKYILSKGVKPLMWYNSGAFKWIQATPRDRLFTHESRMEEFSKLKKMGVAGIKVDFFLSEKQDMINYYLDILKDAANSEMMVYFHGCLVPRGWERTYPNLMTSEAVRGAEWYNNGPEFTTTAPEHNTILPFTRNVVGSMDYTPVTFTNSQYPHITSYGHELALSVVFESGFQHLADRPEGYYELPDAAKNFLREVPNAWDNIKLLDGYPGRDIILARQKSDNWYIGGINGEKIEKTKTLKFDFLPENAKYKLTIISDGSHDKAFKVQYLVIDRSSHIEVKMLRRGGFAASLTLLQ